MRLQSFAVAEKRATAVLCILLYNSNKTDSTKFGTRYKAKAKLTVRCVYYLLLNMEVIIPKSGNSIQLQEAICPCSATSNKIRRLYTSS
jgi:hypothetical protein